MRECAEPVEGQAAAAAGEPGGFSEAAEGAGSVEVTAEREPGGLSEMAGEDDGRACLAGCLAELAAADPAVKSVEDLERLYPEATPRLLAAARAGISPADLFKGLAFDALVAQRVEAARRAAAATAAGKGHLIPAGAGGRAAVAVPSEVRAMYRGLMPGLSEGEIQRAYEQYAKEGKGR